MSSMRVVPPVPWNQPLFDHMMETHGLILTESEMNEIIFEVKKCLLNQEAQRKTITPEMDQLLQRLKGKA